jgi:hypothetical protein
MVPCESCPIREVCESEQQLREAVEGYRQLTKVYITEHELRTGSYAKYAQAIIDCAQMSRGVSQEGTICDYARE